MNRLSKILITSTLLAILAILTDTCSTHVRSHTLGSPAGVSGSPGDGYKTCAKAGCHPGFAIPASDWITSNIDPTGYIPGNTYTITASASRDSINEFGFEVSPQDEQGNILGEIVVTDATETQLLLDGWITHRLGGLAGTNNSKSWSFDWKAPVGVDSVTFYGAFNCSDDMNGEAGDSIFTSQLTVKMDSLYLGSAKRSSNSAVVHVFPNPVKDRLSVLITRASESETSTFSIYDSNGRQIINRRILEGETVDVTAFDGGVYFLVLYTKSGEDIVRKLVKL